ncbi:hypothetical protein [Streptomyces sp. PTD5-9]|uniref:hypothetical protein n=1 Tax=Streptomyces sp. PTD5-9 TaxID=3120150 RepID=UPI003FCD71EA
MKSVGARPPGDRLPPDPAPGVGEAADGAAALDAALRFRRDVLLADIRLISLATVKSHMALLQRKLAVRNRVGIAAWAWESGLASTDRAPATRSLKSTVGRLAVAPPRPVTAVRAV